MIDRSVNLKDDLHLREQKVDGVFKYPHLMLCHNLPSEQFKRDHHLLSALKPPRVVQILLNIGNGVGIRVNIRYARNSLNGYPSLL